LTDFKNNCFRLFYHYKAATDSMDKDHGKLLNKQ